MPRTPPTGSGRARVDPSRGLTEIGRRSRTQPPPPHVVFQALAEPDRDPARPWLSLLDDEQAPRVVYIETPAVLVWSSLWLKRPDALVRFDLADRSGGTALQWTLYVRDPPPDAALTGHFRYRMNQLVNANLRYSFGQ